MSVRTILVLVATIALVVGGLAFYLVAQEPGPLVTIHGPQAVGGEAFIFDVSMDADGGKAASLDAWIEQNGRRFPVLSLSSAPHATITQETAGRVRVKDTVATATVAGLRDGNARLVVQAAAPVLLGMRQATTITGRDILVRLIPPTLAVVSTHHYVTLGGSEMVVYRSTPPAAESGVTVGDRFYRGYPASGIAGKGTTDPSLHVAIFALGFDQDVNTPIRLIAHDAAGNTAITDFEHRSFEARFSYSRLNIDDTFLARVIPPIVANTPGLSLATGTPAERLQAFLYINRTMREQNASKLAALAQQSSAEWLARGVFSRLARSASRAPFAEHRSYVMDGQEIDQQIHLGFDLAATQHAPITASNAGRVVFAGYLGIYGNCVVIDHGLGVQTVYGHMSSIDVEPGDRLEKGEVIGHTGATGMAGGDHVHFSVLVGGTPVTALEWWDAHWVQDRIDRKLEEAGLKEPSPVVVSAPPSPRPQHLRQRPRPRPRPRHR
jgi:murein DD-endopeptidase MepM/ murein hydrolase activator NlpD